MTLLRGRHWLWDYHCYSRHFSFRNSRILHNVCRLQAQGTPGHPERYTSAFDAVRKTYKKEGVLGFYKGLGPTLFKVRVCPFVDVFVLASYHVDDSCWVWGDGKHAGHAPTTGW